MNHEKDDKKGFVPLPVVFVLLLLIAGYALFRIPSLKLGIVSQFDFAGFTWTDNVGTPSGCGSQSGSSLKREGEFVVIEGSYADSGVKRYMQTDLSKVDEVLVIADGHVTAYCSGGGSNAGAGASAQVVGSESGQVSMGFSAGTSTCPSSGQSISQSFEPTVWKFKNNFDGTWSSLKSLGVGDIFIVGNTEQIKGTPYLRIGTELSGCGSSGKGGTSKLRVYNVVAKSNAFAVCKADEFMQDVNGDGKIASDGSECFDLNTIVLNSEEAIKESVDEKISRITKELEAKNSGLASEIEKLKELMAQQPDSDLQNRIAFLEAELKETKKILADVQARDKNVIDAVEQSERFKRPNPFTEFFNQIISWIRGIFAK